MAKFYRGKLSYVHDETGEFGREWFSATVYDDGVRTLRCLCEMDHVKLVRDVTYTVGADFRPLVAHVERSQGSRPTELG